MGIIRKIALAALAAGFFASGGAAAQNLVVNGSFEAGLAGWTVDPNPDCIFESLLAGDTTSGAGAFTAPAPTQGTRVLLSDANAPATCTFFQDVAIPAGSTAQLSLAAGYNFQDFGGGPAGCSVDVDVTTTAAVPIASAFSGSGPANIPLAPQPAVNLTAQAGTTVRIIVTAVSCAGGPVGAVLDNVVLAAAGATNAIPTLDEWAKILLALLMAAFAAVALRRRQRD